MMSSDDELIRIVYAALNARAIDTVLSLMHPDVDWPDGMEAGRVHGHEAVRQHWTREWSTTDPLMDPRRVRRDDDDRIVVEVHQVVRDREGTVLVDKTVHHVYELVNGLITRMEIREG